MRIDRLSLRDHVSIKALSIETTSNMVIIAGANGSGKTRLKEARVYSFRNPNSPQASLTLSATREEEEAAWRSKQLLITAGQNSPELTSYLHSRSGAQGYVGTVIQIDSNRAVQPVSFERFELATPDPDDQGSHYSWYLEAFTSRWQQLVNKIYKKVANRDQKIANFIKTNPEKLGTEALTTHPDPFVPYQQIFARLLPGKTLSPIDPKTPREFHYLAGDPHHLLPFTTLSSGEQEVVKVAFDLVWKQLTHSIILIDEPELHLHPTLTFRLMETLKEFGEGTNQLILFTHSADLISTYYSTGSVYFIDSLPNQTNQAHQLSTLTANHSAVTQAASANLGLFAVGKKLVFIEGQAASVDRLVYHKVAQTVFPDSYMLPIGSVENLLALRAVINELSQAIFGIELFLVRDRDGLSDEVATTLQKNPRFQCLPRRHIENYLLDEDVLSEVASTFYLPSSKRDPSAIRNALSEIASSSLMPAVLWNIREQIRVLGTLSQPTIRNIDQLSPQQLADSLSEQLTKSAAQISQSLTTSSVTQLVLAEHARLQAAILNGDWGKVLPGKIIFTRFCGEYFNTETTRVREAYVDIAMRIKPSTFDDIAIILKSFKELATHSA